MTDAPPPGDDETRPPDGEPHRVGRPSTFSEELGDKILAGMSLCMPFEYAARRARVRPATARGWLERGRALQEGPLWEFAQQVEFKRAQTADRLDEELERVTRDKRHWRSWASRLVRAFPDCLGGDAKTKQREAELDLEIAAVEMEIAQRFGADALKTGEPEAVDETATDTEPDTQEQTQTQAEGAKRRGRPTRFEPDFCIPFLRKIRAGRAFDVACRSLWIHPSTVRAWLSDGEENPSGRYGEFFDQFEEARGEFMAFGLAIILMASRAHDVGATNWLREHACGPTGPLAEKQEQLGRLKLQRRKLEVETWQKLMHKDPEPVRYALGLLSEPSESERRRWHPPPAPSVYGTPKTIPNPNLKPFNQR